jgi:hypothetical protein
MNFATDGRPHAALTSATNAARSIVSCAFNLRVHIYIRSSRKHNRSRTSSVALSPQPAQRITATLRACVRVVLMADESERLKMLAFDDAMQNNMQTQNEADGVSVAVAAAVRDPFGASARVVS